MSQAIIWPQPITWMRSAGHRDPAELHDGSRDEQEGRYQQQDGSHEDSRQMRRVSAPMLERDMVLR
jgi:hypothetical protein